MATVEAPVCIVLPCSCCGLPFARLTNGCIIIESKHHGERHVNAISLSELVKLCQEGALIASNLTI